MYEVELKVPADLGAVRDRLETLGATAEGAVEQVDTYVDHPARSFAETDEALRVRREGGAAVLTYKGPKVDAGSKTRLELETGVDDGETAEAVLEALGFEAVARVEKRRERYSLDGYTVSLDAVAGVGEFVEVEAGGEEAEIDELRAGAEAVLERLGLDPADQVRTSYLELLLDAQQ
ncbi:MAG: class IV adenylate cyclase [Halobacteriales archaeon]|nr:class IV adenylate cyclase [Halobacteriales archaeon]